MSRHSFSGGYNDSAMLSDDGDLYSDDDDAGTVFGGDLRNSLGEKIIPTAADRRAHHNALERKRRDHIKDSFTSLRDSVPSLQGEKVTVSQASRAQILKKAAEYIQFMRKKNNNVQSDIDEIAKQNKMLEEQIRRMEKAKNGGVGGAGSALASMHLAGSSSSSSAAATNGADHSPLLYTEQIEVATSYDTSEQDSNGSNSNGGGGLIIQQHGKPAKIGASGNGSSGISIINAGAGMISLDNGGSPSSSHSSSSPSSSSSSSSPSSLAYSAGPSSASVSASSSLKNGGGTVLLNGSAAAALNGGTLRPVVHLKNGGVGVGGLNGTSKIIVQNPQHKNGGQPHVIHVTTSPAGMLNGVGGGGASKPIIITSAQLSAATAGAQFVINGGPNGKCK